MTYKSSNGKAHEEKTKGPIFGRVCTECGKTTSNGQQFEGKWYCNKCVANGSVELKDMVEVR